MSFATPPLPMINPVTVESSSLTKVAYDSERTILQVEFRDQTIYQYFGVPRKIYQDLRQADSKGAYFNQHIRNSFAHEKLPVAVDGS